MAETLTPFEQSLVDAIAAAGAEDGGKPRFSYGGGNTGAGGYYDSAQSIYDALPNAVKDYVKNAMITAGKNSGMYPPAMMEGIFEGYWNDQGALGVIDSMLSKTGNPPAYMTPEMAGSQGKYSGGEDYWRTPQGLGEVTQAVWNFYQRKVGFDMGQFLNVSPRGGSGSRRPTEQDIRNNFDLDQLANRATDVWRGLLLEEPENARSLARSYVNEIVATGGEKKIDFDTFVESQAKQTARWASVYRSKPENVGAIDYIGRYHQAALNVMRPGNADEVAIAGAQLGADAQSFAGRLQRTDENVRSSNFINGLGERMSSVNSMLRG